MLNLPSAFLGLAEMAGAAFGAPFHAGRIVTPGAAVMDAGGSISTPAVPTYRACTVQIDPATEAMRQQDGFADGDVRFILLAASFTGAVDTDVSVEVTEGPFVGVWSVSSLQRDPVGIGYVGRGRKA